MAAVKYPEHEKLARISEESQAIGEFLEWLKGGYEGSPGYQICVYHDGTYSTAAVIADALGGRESDREHDPSGYVPIRERTDQLLARYFGIDQEKIEKEKRQMLADIREANRG